MGSSDRTAAPMGTESGSSLWAAVLAGSPELLLVFGPDLLCRFCSDAVRETSGFEPDQVLGEHLTRIITDGDRAAVVQAARSAFAEPGVVFDVEFRARHADGTWHLHQARLRSVGAGEERVLVLTSRDVTLDRATTRALGRRTGFEATLEQIQHRFIHVSPEDIDAAIGDALGVTGNYIGADRVVLELATPTSAGRTIAHEWFREATTTSRSPRHTVELPVVVDAEEVGELRYEWGDGPASWDAGDLPMLSTFAGTIAQLLARRDAARERTRSEARLATLLQHLPDPVVRVGPDLEVLFHNEAAAELVATFGDRPDADAHRAAFAENVRRAMAEARTHTAVFDLSGPDGGQVFEARFVPEVGADGRPSSVLLVAADLTERRRSEAELAHRASHDPLTDLPNRALFRRHLGDALDGLGRGGRGVLAVLFLDLDRFKVVNDSMGHAAGDELLCAVGRRLRSVVRAQDVVARLGGDEFTVLLAHCHDADEVHGAATRMQRALAEPLGVAGRELVVTASIGVALATTGAESPDQLMRGADAAMYRAKDRGRSRIVTFDASLEAEARHRLELDQQLRQALDGGGFEVWFQPEVELSTGDIRGAEALVRWRSADGVRPAEEFMWLAEETGLVVPLGTTVLREACRCASRWRRARPEMTVRVNLSARQLDQPDLVTLVADALGRAKLPAAALCLEITETALMENPETSGARLDELHRLGVQLAIDDFGTGYSSLSYLKQFPVSVLKIDRTFVDGLPGDPEDAAIVATIVRLAESLGLGVTAEGVETAAQAEALVDMGCDTGQGDHFGRAVPDVELQAKLAVRR